MGLTVLDEAEDRRFVDGETVWDVDGNAYTVHGDYRDMNQYVTLNVNDAIEYPLEQPDMRVCFTRNAQPLPETVHIERQTVKEENGFRRITIRDRDKKPSWKRFGPGTASVSISSHCKSKYIEFDCEERDIEKEFTKRTIVTIPEAAGRAVFEMLSEVYAPVKAG